VVRGVLPGRDVPRANPESCCLPDSLHSCEASLRMDAFGFVLGLAIGLLLAAVYVLIWKVRYTSMIRQDAVQRSQAVTAGKVHEQLIPYLPGFPYNPKDVRFLGSPVDLVVFDGLAEGRLDRIVFLEIKTGSATLTGRERWVRDVVQAREVEWAELRVARPYASGAV
jgi:predicted Holliday junction resolvase-like endonuclease